MPRQPSSGGSGLIAPTPNRQPLPKATGMPSLSKAKAGGKKVKSLLASIGAKSKSKKQVELYVDPPHPSYVMNGPVMQAAQRGTQLMETVYRPPVTAKGKTPSPTVQVVAGTKTPSAKPSVSGGDTSIAAYSKQFTAASGMEQVVAAPPQQWPHVPGNTDFATQQAAAAPQFDNPEGMNPFQLAAKEAAAANVAKKLTVERPVFATRQTQVAAQQRANKVVARTVSLTKQTASKQLKDAFEFDVPEKAAKPQKVDWPADAHDASFVEEFPLPVITPAK